MTRLQYSGRNRNLTLSRKHSKPATSKKWVRADHQTVQATGSIAQPVKRNVGSTNWGKHSWKRSTDSNGSGTGEMGLDVARQVKIPPPLPPEAPQITIQIEKMDKEEDQAIDEPNDVAMTSENSKVTGNFYKVSRNKLVLKRNEVLESRDDKRKHIKGKKSTHSVDCGEAKPHVIDTTNANITPSQNLDRSVVCKYSRAAPQIIKKRKRVPVAKRINIDSVSTNAIYDLEEKASDGNTCDKDGQIGDGITKGKNSKLLTDFAYRESRTRGINQGLVRVEKRSAKICPTFMKGIECTNVRCMNRHDVPAELAMPICSFFQRKGMCLKEDCKFRHVKVSVNASNCPNFEQKGYCDDLSCKLMHRNKKRAPVSLD